MEQQYFVFREPESFDELKSLLLLRHIVFQESRLKALCIENELGIELDNYDVRAQHFGIFEHSNCQSKPVGYMRLVSETTSKWAQELQTLAGLSPRLAAHVGKPRKAPLPLMSYFPDAEVVQSLYDTFKEAGSNVMEPSRLSLAKSVRSISMARSVIELVFACAMVNGFRYAFTTISPNQKRFYAMFGFTQVEGTGEYCIPETGCDRCCLLGDSNRLPNQIRERVLAMAEAYCTTGRIWLSQQNESNFYAPMESYIESKPRFRAVA